MCRGRGKASAGEHRTERRAPEQVHVKMGNFLPAVPPEVGQQPVAGFDEPLLARDMADRADEAKAARARAMRVTMPAR